MTESDDLELSLLDHLYDAVYVVDLQRRIRFWNRAAEMLTGFLRDEVLGRCCADDILTHVDASGRSLCLGYCPLSHTLADGASRESEMYLHHKSGHRLPVVARIAPLKDDEGNIVGAIEMFRDNSSMLEAREKIEHLRKLALIDSLTGLPNRRFLEDELDRRLAEVRRYGWSLGILFFDIDNFKGFNDQYGHEIGDQVLKMVSRTLEATSRPFDVVGRWGGEEFLGILRNLDGKGLIRVGERFRKLIERSEFRIDSQQVSITVSIGAATAGSSSSKASLLQGADRALYESKRLGRNRLTHSEYDAAIGFFPGRHAAS